MSSFQSVFPVTQWTAQSHTGIYYQHLYGVAAPEARAVDDAQRFRTTRKHIAFPFPSLQEETRTHVGTACAAHWLGRKPQTLRAWACFEDGPLRPTRVNGRLAWSVADIRRVLLGANHDR
jgi:hypothetical protein